jgi:hypothetical protein
MSCYSNLLKLYVKPHDQSELPVENRFFFSGNTEELDIAVTTAIEFGITVGIDEGDPFVNGADNYTKVTEYIWKYKLPGFSNYNWLFE